MKLVPVPDYIRILNIHGIPYYIAWEEMLPGCSFFLKTTVTAKEVQKLLVKASAHYKITLKAHNRNEFGYYGVRVWRIA